MCTVCVLQLRILLLCGTFNLKLYAHFRLNVKAHAIHMWANLLHLLQDINVMGLTLYSGFGKNFNILFEESQVIPFESGKVTHATLRMDFTG